MTEMEDPVQATIRDLTTARDEAHRDLLAVAAERDEARRKCADLAYQLAGEIKARRELVDKHSRMHEQWSRLVSERDAALAKPRPRALVHCDANGFPANFIKQGDVDFYVVSEIAPHDRVYRIDTDAPDEDFAVALADDPVGHIGDERHAALEARIVELIEGKPRLTLVKTDDVEA